jgi:hypothetical protein
MQPQIRSATSASALDSVSVPESKRPLASKIAARNPPAQCVVTGSGHCPSAGSASRCGVGRGGT